MSIKQFFLASAITASTALATILPAQSYGWQDFIKDNIDQVRSRTVGTYYNQKFVQDMSDNELQTYKKEYGDPGYIPYVDTWCGNQIYAQGYRNQFTRAMGRNGIMNGIHATWRYENGKVNCYFRYSGKI
jgi:hypothetical protein